MRGSGEMPMLENDTEAPIACFTQDESVLNSKVTEFECNGGVTVQGVVWLCH